MSELSTAATNILNRLVAAPTYHPGNADLFTDWNLQAGDVVTVAADGENYSVPIYNMKLKWTGQSKVEVESTGNPKREPPHAVNRKSYGSAAGGYGGQKQLSDTLHAAGLFVDPETGVWAYASEQGEDYALGATFSVQSTAINLKVSKGNVSTQLAVECGNVHVSGGNLTVDGYITSEGLKTTTIQVQGVDCRGDIDSQGVRADSIMYGDADVGDAVSSFDTATASGGTITIPYHTLDGGSGNITFNIADTQYYQQGVSAAYASGWSDAYATVRINNNSSGPGNDTINLSYGGSVSVYSQAKANSSASVWTTIGTVTVNAPASTSAYNSGWSDAVDTVRINNSSTGAGNATVNLAAGGSVTVYSQAKANSSASSYTTYGTVTVNAAASATVNVVKGSWSSGNITFSPSSGSGSTASVSLLGTHGTYDATNKRYTVTIWDGDTSHGTGCQVPVNASGAYNAGVTDTTPTSVTIGEADNPTAGSNDKWWSHIDVTTKRSSTTISTFTNQLVDVTKPYNAGVSSVTISRVQNNSGTQNIYNDSSGSLSISVYVRISSGTSGTYTISVPYRCID